MTIGILGGGQLGYMLALAGYPLGLHFRFLDPSPQAPVGRIAARVTGEYEDLRTLERFAHGLTLATYEFENVPVESARFLAERVPVYPPPSALETAQDRLSEKKLFRELGIPTAEFAPVATRAELDQAVDSVGLPAVLKTRRMGYDGKGQWLLKTSADAARAWEESKGVPLILEQFVPFERELSILAVRGRDGATAFYPLVENHHRSGILRLSLAPAPRLAGASQNAAEDYARRVLERLDYVGVLAIELFEHGGRLLANEMAPRVHNSGHWTIEGAVTSQFENHLRAVACLPLGSAAAQGHSAMVNFIGSTPDPAAVLAIPQAHLHLYGKEPRPGRKLGHVTLCAETAGERSEHLGRLAAALDRASICLDEVLPSLASSGS